MSAARAANRERMAAAMPECLRLIDDLKALSMFGKLVKFEVFEK